MLERTVGRRSMGNEIWSLVQFEPRSRGEWGAARLGGAGEDRR